MTYDKDGALDYMRRMRGAVGTQLIEIDGTYAGRDGHLRLARECGVALADFDESGRNEILKGSYSAIYIIGCDLKPILDAGEWIKEMRVSYLKENARRRNVAYDKAVKALADAGLCIGGGLCDNFSKFPVFTTGKWPDEVHFFGYIDKDCSKESVMSIIAEKENQDDRTENG
jgi:hypothetical protein